MNIPVLYKLIVKLSRHFKKYFTDDHDHVHKFYSGDIYNKFDITIKEFKFIKRLSAEKIHLIADKSIEKLEETIKIMEILK